MISLPNVGDVFFVSYGPNQKGPTSDLISRFQGSEWSHCGIYAGHGKIIESVFGQGVVESELTKYAVDGNKVMFMRAQLTPAEVEAVMVAARAALGTVYSPTQIAITAIIRALSAFGFKDRAHNLAQRFKGTLGMTCCEMVLVTYSKADRPLSDVIEAFSTPRDVEESPLLSHVYDLNF